MEHLNNIEALGFDSLSEAMEVRLKHYFDLHNGIEVPSGLYDLIIKEIEKSLLSATMQYAEGNKVKAARILGINRNTLHKKLITLELNNEC